MQFSGSFYTTIALAFERLNAMKLRPLPQPGRSSPLKVSIYTSKHIMSVFFMESFKYCLLFDNSRQHHIFQTYPTNFIMILICIMAMIYNLPRLFDTQSTYQSHKFVQRIGNSGDAAKDFRIIVVSSFYLILLQYYIISRC